MKSLLTFLVAALTVDALAAQDHGLLNDSTQAVQPVVDVRAMARQQIEMAKTIQRTLESRRSASPENPNALLPILLLMVILLGVIGALWVVVRKPRPKGTPVEQHVTLTARPQTPPENPVDALLRQAQLILLEKKAQRTLHAPQRALSINTNIAIARTFGRAQGELTLAQKLEASGTQYPWEEKLCADDIVRSGENPAAAAKNLGVGTGELKLLHTLRTMQAQQGKGIS